MKNTNHLTSCKGFSKSHIYILLALFSVTIGACSKSGSSNNEITFSDVVECPNTIDNGLNMGTEFFIRRDVALGLTEKHSFTSDTWGLSEGVNRLEQVMQVGGVTATYLNLDCWPDMVFPSGDGNGLIAYSNKGGQSGFENKSEWLSGTRASDEYKLISGVAVADLDGSYRRELVLGNLLGGSMVVLSAEKENILFSEMDRLPVTRTTFGMSFGDIDGNGFLDMYAAHWDYEDVTGEAPVLWRNLGAGLLVPDDEQSGLAYNIFNQQYNFTPQFADIRNSGVQDLVLASDFNTSAVLQNNGLGVFTEVTNKEVISDQFGMGSALGDINNNGKLDWFVSSIYTLNEQFNTPLVDGSLGNRLYKNLSTPEEIVFSDITEAAGVKDGAWGWGSCMADFNHDGFLDIFHANGYGYIPDYVEDDPDNPQREWYDVNLAEFTNTIPRLFINNGNATFTDATVAWGLGIPSEGRGITCFDYDRDGDTDIALVDHSTGIQFFENQIGNSSGKRFLNIRVVGNAPNTDAIGTKIFVTTDVGNGHGVQRQMRISHANSNFNSQNLPDIHFGLGVAEKADLLRVEWPDGTGLLCRNVSGNQFLVFDQRKKKQPGGFDCSWHQDIQAISEG